MNTDPYRVIMEGNKRIQATYNPEHDLAYLRNRGVEDFIHFTPVENIESILRNGLIPRGALDTKGIEYTSTDNSRIESKKYINLSITFPNVKLFYGKRKEIGFDKFVVITLDPNLLRDATGGYAFTNDNAAALSTKSCNVEELFSGVRPEFFEPNWPTNNQSEVLVMDQIHPRFIKEIHFPLRNELSEQRFYAYAEYFSNLAKDLNLNCEMAICDYFFDYNKRHFGEDCEQRSYDYYTV